MIAYLDNAATTPVSPEAAQAACNAMTTDFGNPSTQYPLGKAAKKALDGHRKAVADALGCKPAEVVFTSCGTESDNWALRLGAQKNRRKGRHIITTAFEHSAILQTCHEMEAEGWEVTYLMPNRQGQISLDDLKAALRPDTVLVSMMLVNNELGCVLPVKEAAALVKAYDKQILFHTDAVQGFLKVPFSAKTLGADMITISGHKIHAPKGIGALYIRSGLKLPPYILGGGQERGMRAGTEATPQIAAFGTAAEIGSAKMAQATKTMAELRAHAIDRLTAEVDGLVVIGGGSPHILSISLPGYRSEVLMNFLEARGIYTSKSSACKKGGRSHVLEAIGLPANVIDGALRISFSRYTTREDIDALCDALRDAKQSLFPSLR